MATIFVNHWCDDLECCSKVLQDVGVSANTADAACLAQLPILIIDGDQQAAAVVEGLNACGCVAQLGGSSNGFSGMSMSHVAAIAPLLMAQKQAPAKSTKQKAARGRSATRRG